MKPDLLRYKTEFTLDEVARLWAGVEAETPENRENVISTLRILLGAIEKLRLFANGPDSIADVPLRSTISGDYNWDSPWRYVMVSRQALEDWFAREGLTPPKGLTPVVGSSPPPSDPGGKSRKTLLRIIGGLVVLLIDKTGKKYREGQKLNRSALHADIESTLHSIGAPTRGGSQSRFYEIFNDELCQDILKVLTEEE